MKQLKTQEKNISVPKLKKKLSFNEKREFEKLETEIAELEKQKNNLEKLLNSGTLTHGKLFSESEKLGKIKTELDEKEFRWLELSEWI